MNIGQPNFQILSPQQANPALNGLRQAIAMHLQQQQVQKNNAMLPFIAPQQQALLQQQQLANQKQQDLLPFVAPSAQASLDQTRASTQNVLEQAIAQKIRNQYLPQEQQADIGLKGAQANFYNMGGGRGGVDQRALQTLQNLVRQEHPDWPDAKISDAASGYLNGDSTFADGSPLPVPSGSISYMLNSMAKHVTPTAKAAQQTFASNLETEFNSGDKLIDNAAQFAGLAGKTQGGVDAVKAQLGEDDPRYRDYLNFTTVTVPAIATELLKIGGASSTDTQKLTAMAQANPINLYNNPKLAIEQYKYLKSLYGSVAKNLSKGIAQTQTDLKHAGESSPAVMNASNSPSMPKVGDTVKGYTYIGGPPGDKNSWRKN